MNKSNYSRVSVNNINFLCSSFIQDNVSVVVDHQRRKRSLQRKEHTSFHPHPTKKCSHPTTDQCPMTRFLDPHGGGRIHLRLATSRWRSGTRGFPVAEFHECKNTNIQYIPVLPNEILRVHTTFWCYRHDSSVPAEVAGKLWSRVEFCCVTVIVSILQRLLGVNA